MDINKIKKHALSGLSKYTWDHGEEVILQFDS
jgi:hypothetical protein